MKPIIIPETYKYISAFLTMRCNLNCSFCLNSLDKSKEFNRNKFKEISGEQWVGALNRIASRENLPVTFSGGEPFLHPDFIYILNNLKPELKIDILTNLYQDSLVDAFLEKVDPKKITRKAPYASIRVSYHPEEMDPEKLIKNVVKLKNAGFSVGIWSVLYPGPEQLSAINLMQFRCLEAGIEFRLKEYTGTYEQKAYGDYSKFPGSTFSEKLKNCLCKTSELLIGPDGNVYRCHRDVFSEEFPIGSLLNSDFEIKDEYRECVKYGECHPCDVKLKTNHKQELGSTSVEIRGVNLF